MQGVGCILEQLLFKGLGGRTIWPLNKNRNISNDANDLVLDKYTSLELVHVRITGEIIIDR